MMKNFLIDGWAFVVVLSLLACSDHSSKADDDHESGVKNPSVNCVPRSTKALKKESLSPSFVNSLTGAGTFSFDVVVRDFEPNHPDFENFSEEAVNNLDDIYNYISPTGTAMKDNGYDDTWYGNSAYHNTCGNASSFEKFGVGVQIGIDGLPIKANPLLPGYLQPGPGRVLPQASPLHTGHALQNGPMQSFASFRISGYVMLSTIPAALRLAQIGMKDVHISGCLSYKICLRGTHTTTHGRRSCRLLSMLKPAC